MDRTGSPQRGSGTDVSGCTEQSDEVSHPEVVPDSWRDVTEFVDRFDDAVFGVLADPDDEGEEFWIVRDISKVRPAAIPLDEPPTFDLSVLGPNGVVVDDLRLTIGEIEHVRAAEPSGVSAEIDEA